MRQQIEHCNEYGITSNMLVVTLNISGLNAPIIRQGVNKQDSTVCCLQETHLIIKTHIN